MPRKLTNEEFIEKAKKVHGDKYDYSLVDYKRTDIKVTIICPIHGKFEQTPELHLSGFNCKKCSGKNIGEKLKLSNEEFIEKAKKVHGDKYDYSLVDYINYKTPITIICKIHGEFKQTPSNHLQGYCCKKCSNNYQPSNIEFIEKLKKVHGDKYDYSLVEYKNNCTDIKIICKKHGVFSQNPIAHRNGSKCPHCSHNKHKTTESFIKEAISIHGDKYDYSLVKYKNVKDYVKIKCIKHNYIFKQTPDNHLSGCGCPKYKLSKGETKIMRYLESKNILYEYQKKFKECKNIFELPFDFYLPEYNLCIEFDGKHHFIKNESWGGDEYLNKVKIRDKIKDEYCKNINNIHLLRIKYDENVVKKLDQFFQSFSLPAGFLS
jgi:very-short-patch-repair endonuclease